MLATTAANSQAADRRGQWIRARWWRRARLGCATSSLPANRLGSGQPEIALGIMPGGGATQRLPRTVGKARAMEMVLLGEPISAWDALDAGLVNRVVPDELVLTAALRLAQSDRQRSRSMPPIAAKAAVLAAFDLPMEAGLNAERAGFNALFDTADAQEGMTAFLEKRKPVFGSIDVMTSFASPLRYEVENRRRARSRSIVPTLAMRSIRSWPNPCSPR